MRGLAWRVLRDRWQLLAGTLIAITLGVALVHSGLAIAETVAAAQPPAGLTDADRASYLARLNGTNTINGIASILGVFLTVFVVRSTIDFAVTERRRELALLRLIGVRRHQLHRMLLAEALLLGALGTGAGSILGILLAALQRELYVRIGVMPADVAVSWKPEHALLDAGVGLAVALAGAWTSSRRAMRVTPLQALHQLDDQGRPMTASRWVWGSLAVVATLAQLAFSLMAGGILAPLLFGLGIIMTGSIAATQLSPLLVPATARLAGRVVRGPLSALALASVRDNARRTAQIAAPLIVLVSLVAGLQGLLDTQTRAGNIELADTTRADLIVSTHGDPATRVAALPGVATAGTQVQVPAAAALTHRGTTIPLPGTVWAVNPARLAAMHPYRPVSGSLTAFDDHHVVLGPGLENLPPPGTTDYITITIDGQSHRLTEAARTEVGIAANDGMYVPRSAIPDTLINTAPSIVFVTLAPGSDTKQVKDAITRLGLGTVTTPAEEAAQRDAIKNDENRAVMTALVGVGSLYALVSLLSTIAIATGQRRSEFAIHRLSGLTRSQVAHVTQLETLTTITVGLLLGTTVSTAALAGLWVTTWKTLGTPAITIPWLLLAALAALVIMLAAATTWTAVRTATNRPPVHDITTKE